jgi:hypothetical protein
MRRPSSLTALVTCVLAASAFARLPAQEPYRLPPKVVVDILDAPPAPATLVSPDRAWLLLADRAAMPTIADLSQPMLRLAGSRINPATNGPFRAVSYTGLRFDRIADGQQRVVSGVSGAKIGWPIWSPDGRRVAFTVTGSAGIGLWTAAADSAQARPLMAPALNAMLGSPCTWMPDSAELLCRLVPVGRGAAPVASRVPAGPHVQAAEGRPSPAPTYEDLLQNPVTLRIAEASHGSRGNLVRIDRE